MEGVGLLHARQQLGIAPQPSHEGMMASVAPFAGKTRRGCVGTVGTVGASLGMFWRFGRGPYRAGRGVEPEIPGLLVALQVLHTLPVDE